MSNEQKNEIRNIVHEIEVIGCTADNAVAALVECDKAFAVALERLRAVGVIPNEFSYSREDFVAKTLSALAARSVEFANLIKSASGDISLRAYLAKKNAEVIRELEGSR